MLDPDLETPAERQEKPRRSLVFIVLGIPIAIALLLLLLLVVSGGLSRITASKVRAEARKVACANNLKQIGLAALYYSSQHDAFPFASVSPKGQGFPHIQVLFDTAMLDDPEVVICPASTLYPSMTGQEGNYILTAGSCSYSWNRTPLASDCPPETPLAACRHDESGWNVLFVGGKVNWVPAREFEKRHGEHFVSP